MLRGGSLRVGLSALLLGVGLAGCSGDDPGPKVLPSLTATATPTAGPVEIPTAARAATSEALDAFVRFYFAELNAAFSTSDGDRVRRWSDPRCATCENYAKALDDGAEFIRGESFSELEVAAPPVTPSGTVVTVLGVVPEREVLNREGQLIKRLPADGRFHFELNVLLMQNEWRVRGIRIAT